MHTYKSNYGCFIRIMCYNAGLKDENKFGELEREYMDPSNAKVYAIEYNAQSKLRTCFCIMHIVGHKCVYLVQLVSDKECMWMML